jgi:glucose-1-phosphate adenylyltransferase
MPEAMPGTQVAQGLKETLTIILAGGQGQRLYPLTRDRAKPSVPFGGSYRIIDFTLSNCLNSGLRRVYVLTQYKSLSLERHIRQGWQLFNEFLGEFIVPIPPQQRLGGSWYLGTADAIYQNIYTLERERPRYVLILSGDHIYKMNYAKMLADHQERGADLTVACIEVGAEEAPHFGIAVVDDEQRMRGWQEKPENPEPVPGTTDRFLASMGVYIFNTDSLVRRVSKDARKDSKHDFGQDIIPSMLEADRVFAYPFRDENPGDGPAYWRDIGRISAYYEANMDLTAPDPQFKLYDERWPIWTAPVNVPPVKTVSAQEGGVGQARDSLVAPGSILRGSHVERSVLGYEVRLAEGCMIHDSILMGDVKVGEGADIRRAIVDKHVRIPAGVVIGQDPEEDRRRFTVKDGGIVVVPRGQAF